MCEGRCVLMYPCVNKGMCVDVCVAQKRNGFPPVVIQSTTKIPFTSAMRE